MKKYRVETYSNQPIDVIEIDRETESSFWIRGLRSAKSPGYLEIFDTWEEAHSCLLVRAEKNVEDCRQRFDSSKEELTKIKCLVKDC